MHRFLAAATVTVAILGGNPLAVAQHETSRRLAYPAYDTAQIASGTLIVMNVSKNKLVLAADSRALGRDGQPDDAQCKIGVFKHTIVIATGLTSLRTASSTHDPVGSWRNLDLAREAASTVKIPDYVDAKSIAASWADLVASHWRKYYLWFPASVTRIAEANKGILTYGLFATAHAGAINYAVVGVFFRFPGRNLDPISVSDADLTDCWTCGQDDSRLCALGKTEIAKDFCSEVQTTETQRGHGHLKNSDGFDRQESLSIDLVDMTSRYDISNSVGGETDAVELMADGKISWLLNNKHCAEE